MLYPAELQGRAPHYTVVFALKWRCGGEYAEGAKGSGMAHLDTSGPVVGSAAPPFELKDSELQPVRLHQFGGKTVVLAFFPAAFSSTCTSELCALNMNTVELGRLDAVVLGISVDLPWTLREFRKASHIGFPLLSDFDREVIHSYGVVDREFNGYRTGVARRSVFVIGGDGDLVWKWVSNKQTDEPEYAEVLQAVEALRA
ncbi:MAG: peroxiredoxin [Chloroflexota bacterium]